MRLMILGLLGCIATLSAHSDNVSKAMADDEAKVRAVHQAYFQALGAGDMAALAEQFTFPAAFKGFLDDVAVATDEASLIATYEKLIAAAPKAARSEILALDVSYVRPGVYMLVMNYEQFGDTDELIHAGRAVYFMKRVGGDYKLFGVF